ncbi:CidA/LrgA family protein [Anaeromyxobacter paludicola]|uniref:CidA/LrgA family protein n=1 Tax=Anaeromyxobacter paludicola TaxID=2918171 RepID=A0ABM7X674_9BACT|nr:CidA/LrgA family protein [Anaeromyxobacter paludicola]BDG07322.1 CidA/LrgA family protein [Anaeromyxobacter paludicola]
MPTPRLRLLLQLALLVPFWAGGALLSSGLHLPVPGGVVGLGLLLAALAVGLVRVEWLADGAEWLFRHMLLFFIPAAVGVVDYPELFGREGLRAVAAIAISTALAMAATGAAVEWVSRRRGARA